MIAVDRIKTERDVTAWVAPDTIDLIAGRVDKLLAAGRRMTVVRRWMYDSAYQPEVSVGLTLESAPQRWTQTNGAGYAVNLKPGLRGFGFTAYPDDDATEEAARRRYHSTKDNLRQRTDLTVVYITGGLPNDGPARDDRFIMEHWNNHGVGEEIIVAFDYETGRSRLASLRDEVRQHMETTKLTAGDPDLYMLEYVLRQLDGAV